MSIIFGIWKDDGDMVATAELHRLAAATERYAPDGMFVHPAGGIGMGIQPYHTHERSKLDSQPYVDLYGNTLTFDGRLDNHRDLCRLFDLPVDRTPDSQIVLASFDRWGEKCFARLIGDWALALWSFRERCLYLAKDHAGTRTLYFEPAGHRLLWSTHLETFFVDNRKRDLDVAYAARFLAGDPVRDLTPYSQISAISPAHYRAFHPGRSKCVSYWEPLAKERIHYSRDSEYEEHFRCLFRQSVIRRTETGSPALAQLSGGLDSTSIVSMSDHIRRQRGDSSENLIDTLSYYDDSEPHWNERPYFTLTEVRRGKMGTHIDRAAFPIALTPFEPSLARYLFPGATGSTIVAEERLNAALGNKNFRVLISGLGGDEFLGGRPDPVPELADYLRKGQTAPLIRQSIQWSLDQRWPLISMLWSVGKSLLSSYGDSTHYLSVPPWLKPNRSERDDACTARFHTIFKLWPFLPSSIERATSWEILLETLPHRNPDFLVRLEYRYPFLDRDLVDFLLRIPCEQLLRPGQRRSLMRRALKNIVPAEILGRRRKAYVMRGPLVLLRENATLLHSLFKNSRLSAQSLVDGNEFQRILEQVTNGNDVHWTRHILRTVLLELWMRSIEPGVSRLDVASIRTQDSTGSTRAMPLGSVAGVG